MSTPKKDKIVGGFRIDNETFNTIQTLARDTGATQGLIVRKAVEAGLPHVLKGFTAMKGGAK